MLSINDVSRRCANAIALVSASLILVAAPAFASDATSAAARAYTVDVPSVAGLRDAGSLAGTAPVHLGFVLAYQHANELERDVLLVSTKGSPEYRHFVSSAQWNAYFAPSAATVRATAIALQRAGFRIESIPDNRGVIDAVAPASVVSGFFATQLRAVIQPSVGLRYRNATPALIPQALRGTVLAVTGLDTLERHRLPIHPRFAPAPLNVPSPNAAAQQARIGGPVTAPDGGYGPVVLANGYQYPVQRGYDGTGTTVGITIPDTYLDSDTAAFLKYFHIKQSGKVTRFPVNGGYTGPLAGEATLDTETISSLAPGANIDVYQFPDFSTRSIIDTYNRVVSDNVVDSVSNSWGGCELGNPPLYLAASNIIFQQAALKGITFIFSSGDSGAYTCGGTTPTASDPASQPYVVAVGGISFKANAAGKIVSTTASWVDARKLIGPGIDGGGAVSQIWPLPAYQNNVAVSKKGRNVPDLSLPGDVEDAWYIVGGWHGPVGGTSWSAPAFNAMLTEVNEVIGQENGMPVSRSGFVNPSLYAAYGSVGNLVFTDVTQGNNGAFIGPGFSATPGFDLATGLGTPIGFGLAQFL